MDASPRWIIPCGLNELLHEKHLNSVWRIVSLQKCWFFLTRKKATSNNTVPIIIWISFLKVTLQTNLKLKVRVDFPGGPVDKILSFQSRGQGVIPSWGTRSHKPQLSLRALEPTSHNQLEKPECYNEDQHSQIKYSDLKKLSGSCSDYIGTQRAETQT